MLRLPLTDPLLDPLDLLVPQFPLLQQAVQLQTVDELQLQLLQPAPRSLGVDRLRRAVLLQIVLQQDVLDPVPRAGPLLSQLLPQRRDLTGFGVGRRGGLHTPQLVAALAGQ